MTNEMKLIREEFKTRIRALEEARVQLKKEFIGIDNPIDQLIDNVRSWHTMSKLQDRPLIVNLWGLTGVGKTSLVYRLMELINFKDSTYHFDMGEKTGSFAFREKFGQLCNNDANEKIAIVLDEFQFARTIKPGLIREEVEDDKSRLVWELIDSGKITSFKWRNGLYFLNEFIRRLDKLINSGLKAKEGKVVSKKNLFSKEILSEELTPEELKEKGELCIIPEHIRKIILDELGIDLGFHLETDIEDFISGLDALGALEFTQKAFDLMKRPQVKHFTQAIIFIVGNMDEAYLINQNYSADIDADEFHALSLEVKLPKIKKALRTRFRDEQIARMGNTHIIYPALTKDSYEKIIWKELHRIAAGIIQKYDVEMRFEESVMQKIYLEGVFPTQGVRPVLTTIQQVVKSKLSTLFYEMINQNLSVDYIRLDVQDDKLIAKFTKDEEEIHHFSIKIESTLNDLRKNTKDDQQTITAVHESGHAVISAALLGEYPEYILSVTSDSNAHGFIYSKHERKFVTRKEMMNRVAMYLGGMVAEEMIFGNEFLTDGNGSDIHKAYGFVSTLLKQNGFSGSPLYYADHTNEEGGVYHNLHEIEEEIRSIIINAKEIALKTLEREKKLLLITANYLSNNSRMEKTMFKQLADIHATEKFSLPIPSNFYQQQLRNQVETFGVLKETIDKIPVLLNKEK